MLTGKTQAITALLAALGLKDACPCGDPGCSAEMDATQAGIQELYTNFMSTINELIAAQSAQVYTRRKRDAANTPGNAFNDEYEQTIAKADGLKALAEYKKCANETYQRLITECTDPVKQKVHANTLLSMFAAELASLTLEYANTMERETINTSPDKKVDLTPQSEITKTA